MSLIDNVKATLKSKDTEGAFELYVTRTPGYLWACLFKWMGVHPVVVTLISIVIGGVNMVTVAFLLLNRVRLYKRLGHVHGANMSGFSHLLLLHCHRSRCQGTISSLFSCINGPTAHLGRVAPRHLRDLLWKGGVTV